MIALPPLREQRAIGDALSALDHKIDSNRRSSALLHELTGQHFARRFGDLSIEVAARRGWIEGRLEDLVSVTMGQSPPGSSYSSDPADGMLLVQGMGSMGDRYPKGGLYTAAPAKLARQGATLMTVRAPVGAVNVAHVDLCLGRGVAAMEGARPAFTEYFVRALGSRWASEESGTIFPAVNKRQIVGMRIAIPPEHDLDAFEALARPIAQQLWALHAETETLTEIRDVLIPKLVSGQIRVPAKDAHPLSRVA